MVTKIRNGGLFLEFQKIKLHRSEKNGAAVTQITLDDDYNVPDYRQDIVKVIKERGGKSDGGGCMDQGQSGF